MGILWRPSGTPVNPIGIAGGPGGYLAGTESGAESIESTRNKLSLPEERWTYPARDHNAKMTSQTPLAGKHFALAGNHNHRISKRAAEASHHLLSVAHQLDLIFADLGLSL